MQEKLEKKHQPTYLQKTIKAHKNQTKSPSWLDGNQFKATVRFRQIFVVFLENLNINESYNFSGDKVPWSKIFRD